MTRSDQSGACGQSLRCLATLAIALSIGGALACDLPPQVLQPDRTEQVGDMLIASTDNPALVALGKLHDVMTHPDCEGCEGVMNVRFPRISPADPEMDLHDPDRVPSLNRSEQRTDGELAYRIHAEVRRGGGDVQYLPFFHHGMGRLSVPLFVAEGGAVTSYIPRRSFYTVPWVHFLARTDDAPCQSVTGACETYRDNTFPLLAGNLMLPPGPIHSSIYMVSRHTRNLGSSTLVVEDYRLGPLPSLSLSEDVPLVLVHVHIFVNPAGTNPLLEMFSVAPNQSMNDAAALVQDLFDRRQVRVLSEDPTPGAFSNATALRAGIHRDAAGRAPLEVNVDGAFARCGVALRLASVNFIRQSDGIESSVGGFYRATPNEMWRRDLHPVAGYVRDIATRQAELNPQGCGDTACQPAPPGIHLFATGSGSADLGSAALAVADSLESSQLIAMDAGRLHRAGEFANTIAHELTHSLGLSVSASTSEVRECQADRFASTFFPQAMTYSCPDLPATGPTDRGGPGVVPYPDPALESDADACTRIQAAAASRAAAVPADYDLWPVELNSLLE